MGYEWAAVVLRRSPTGPPTAPKLPIHSTHGGSWEYLSCIMSAEMEAVSPSPSPDAQAAPRPNYVYWGGPNLYVNLTSRCSASCTFCLRTFTWEVFGYDLRLAPDQEPSAVQVIEAAQAALGERRPREVVFTGLGEPTLRLLELTEVLRWANARGLPTRLDTNGHGQLLNPGHHVARELADAGLDAVSISLNAPDAEAYEAICRPVVAKAFAAVVEFIRDVVALGLEVTVTAVDVPGLDLPAVMELATELGAGLRVRRLITPADRSRTSS